jgi:hypothetical protein
MNAKITKMGLDSDRMTIDLRHQTEERKRPEITQGKMSRPGIEREIPASAI